ncbi:MAG: alpha-glucosidase/alpha-galactosidase, partial [Chloroflexi bacterium]|nr:alpha-glucosidase/alpha-galactosidase [Chloroflexota bacterium]
PGVVSHWQYRAVTTLSEALQGADFVILSIQPGPLELMAADVAIAERYGLYFPVGDTSGAPGLARGLRATTIYAGIAQEIATHCPHAWVINFTNPMSICTRALTRAVPGLKVFGCCHEVFATQRMLAGLVARNLGLEDPPRRAEIQVNVLGINHFTWIDQATYQGHDLLAMLRQHLQQPGIIRTYSRQEVESWQNWFFSADQVKFALFQRFGILAAAGDRHLVEFLPGFIQSPETLFRWGIIRTPVSWRIQRRDAAPQHTRTLMSGDAPFELRSSGEEGVGMIKALLGLGELVTNVNLSNRGQIANLPLEAVVETNALFRSDGIYPLNAGALPAGLAPLVAQHVANQETIVEAALSGDHHLAFQAFLTDPTNSLPIDTAWDMFCELLQASREYLPEFQLQV